MSFLQRLIESAVRSQQRLIGGLVRSLRLIAIAAMAAVALIGSAPVALATPPEIVDFSLVFADCSEYPDAGSDALIMASGTLRVSTMFRFEDGEPVVEMRHFTFDGILTGPGGTAAYEGTGNQTLDLLTGEARQRGSFRYRLPDGLIAEAGMTRVDFDTFEVTFQTPHNRDAAGAICAAIG